MKGKAESNTSATPFKKDASAVARILYIIFLAMLTGSSCNPKTVSASSGSDDIAGVVTGSKGPEAGVWVIAETHDLPTRFAKIVVTDDQGNYLIPDLPNATYDIWVRGYGLVDSPKEKATPGDRKSVV